MNLTAAPRKQLIAFVLQLRDENQHLRDQNKQLTVQLAKLERQLSRLRKQTHTDPPLHFKTNAPEKTKGDRRKRAVNFGRRRDVPDRIVKHAYQCCPDCRKKVSPRLDLTDTVLGNHRVSFRLMSLIAALREQCRLPLGIIRSYLKMFHQLQLSEGEITAVLNAVAGLAGPVHQHLKDQIRGSPVVHGDETGWRQNGRNGYLWSFSTPTVKYLLYRKSRGRQVVQEVIGDEFEGVLISDFYGAYNVHQGYHQRCWAHLLRDVNKLVDDYPDHQQLKQWALDVTGLFQTAKDYSGPDRQQYPTPRAQKQQRVR